MKNKFLSVTLCALLFGTSALRAISLASFDNFTNSTENWVEGGVSPNPPTLDGAGHLMNTSDGAGPGGRQLMWNNNAEWTGDYISAGVSAIQLLVDNRSGPISNLSLRVAFDGAGGWFVSNAQVVSDTNMSDEWTLLTFNLVTGNFTWINASGGTGNFNDTFNAVSRFEILVANGLPNYAAAGDILQGDQVTSDLRFDNIQAVPEPHAFGLLGVVATGVICLWNSRRRCA